MAWIFFLCISMYLTWENSLHHVNLKSLCFSHLVFCSNKNLRYFINLHLKMLIGIGIQWYSNFLTTIFLIGLTSSYMYMYSIRFSSVSKKLCKIILNKLVWDKRHYSVSFFWPFLSLWLLFSLIAFSVLF